MSIFGRKPNVEKLKERRNIKGLIKALKDEDKNVRREAVSALGKIGDKRAVEPLIEALKDKDKNVREAMEEALEKIKEKKDENDKRQTEHTV